MNFIDPKLGNNAVAVLRSRRGGGALLQTGSDSATLSPPFPFSPSRPQSLLGTHNLGRVHYEPIKDRHGNVLLVTIRDLESQHSLFNGKWMQVAKLQSQRKSLSTPEEPYALDILIITLQVGRGGCSHQLKLFSFSFGLSRRPISRQKHGGRSAA